MVKIRPIIICFTLLSCASYLGCENKGKAQNTAPDSKDTSEVVKLSISQTLRDSSHLPVEERVALYRKLKKENPNSYNFDNEDEITMYGYSLLWGNKIKEAVVIFKLIVDEFPDHFNPYDSYGEGLLASGDSALALVNYEKSLELNPDNFGAEDQIERIKFPNRKPETPGQKFAKVYTVKQYKEDLDQLGKKLLEIHPNALKFISKEDFLKTIEEKKALITDRTTFAEFYWHCSEIIASVHCSHTSIGNFYFENQMLPASMRFPLQVRWVNDQLFIIDALNNGKKVKIKDEILTINGRKVPDIIKNIYNHISAQGYIQTTKKHFFNTWATRLLAYELNLPEKYEITVKGKKGSIVLNESTNVKNIFDDPSIKTCYNNLCLDILDDNKTAILTVSSFNYYRWNNYKVFQNFMDTSFMKINEKGIKNLVIDVRFNGGGSPESSIYLLQYLIDKPFEYYSRADFPGKDGKSEGEEIINPHKNVFKGKLYFIMDGIGNSTTGHFMSIVKVLNLGTIVGEELGSNQFCSAGQTIRRLSNTKIEIYIANNTHESIATELPDEKGILPDHYVTQSIDDYLNNVDVVKEFTLKLIKK